MDRPNPFYSTRKPWLPVSSRDVEPEECYEGVELAPKTLRSLVTWDVSSQARSEQERLDSACRSAKPTIFTDAR